MFLESVWSHTAPVPREELRLLGDYETAQDWQRCFGDTLEASLKPRKTRYDHILEDA